MSGHDNLGDIRALLLDLYGDLQERIVRFCYDDKVFQPVYDQLTPNLQQPQQIVDLLIQFAEQNELFSYLIERVILVQIQEDHSGVVRIFLNYVPPDVTHVRQIHQRLTELGFSPWLDRVDIAPGEIRPSAIQRAVETAHIFLACVSTNTLPPSEQFQEAITQAHSPQNEAMAVIPVRLESCNLPDTLALIQPVDLFQTNGWRNLLKAVHLGLMRRCQPPTPRRVQMESPYDAMHPASKFYIERSDDEACREQIERRQGVTLFVQAPRQMGKTSLLRRTLHHASTSVNKRYAFVNFHRFSTRFLADEALFLKEFCSMVGEELGLPDETEHHWRGLTANLRKCDTYFSRYLIPRVGTSFILALDGIERLVQMPSEYRINFFSLLRAWHEARTHTNFVYMSLFLSSAIDSYLLIDNPIQSPFNVAQPFLLQDFTRAEVEELNRRHQTPLQPEHINSLMTLIGGHTFLTRLALYHLSTGKMEMDTLLSQATDDNGIFGTHLSHHLLRISEKPSLKKALIGVLKESRCDDDRIYHELKSSGLVTRDGSEVSLRNQLYARYFEARLLN